MENLFLSPDPKNHALGYTIYSQMQGDVLKEMVLEWVAEWLEFCIGFELAFCEYCCTGKEMPKNATKIFDLAYVDDYKHYFNVLYCGDIQFIFILKVLEGCTQFTPPKDLADLVFQQHYKNYFGTVIKSVVFEADDNGKMSTYFTKQRFTFFSEKYKFTDHKEISNQTPLFT